MLSIAQLAEARRAQFQELVGECVAPVFRELQDGEPEFSCSGFLVQLGDRTVLVSAGHALSNHAPMIWLRTGRMALLANSPVCGDRTLSYREPLNDIGSVLLTREEAAEIRNATVPPSTIAPFEHRASEAVYLTLGYWGRRQRLDHGAAIFHNRLASVLLGQVEPKYRRDEVLPADQALLLGAEPRFFRGPDGAGGVPKFRGMSGAPVWRYNPTQTYSVHHFPPLVGMLVGQPSHTKKALLVLRAALIIEHLAAAHPQLAIYLPRFEPSAS